MSNIILKERGYFRQYSFICTDIKEKAPILCYQTNERFFQNLILENHQQISKCAVTLEEAKG